MAAKPKAVPDQPKSPISVFKIDGETYRFDWRKLMGSEARFIQRTTDLTVKQWQQGVEEMDAYCITTLVGLMRHRAHPDDVDLKTIDLDDIEFDLGSFEIVEDSEADPPTEGSDASSDSAPPAVA